MDPVKQDDRVLISAASQESFERDEIATATPPRHINSMREIDVFVRDVCLRGLLAHRHCLTTPVLRTIMIHLCSSPSRQSENRMKLNERSFRKLCRQ